MSKDECAFLIKSLFIKTESIEWFVIGSGLSSGVLYQLLLLPNSGMTESFCRSNRLNPQFYLQELWSVYQIILFLFPGFCLNGGVFKGINVAFVVITFVCLMLMFVLFFSLEKTIGWTADSNDSVTIPKIPSMQKIRNMIGMNLCCLICFSFISIIVLMSLTIFTGESNLRFMGSNGFCKDTTGLNCPVVGCAGVLRSLLFICFIGLHLHFNWLLPFILLHRIE